MEPTVHPTTAFAFSNDTTEPHIDMPLHHGARITKDLVKKVFLRDEYDMVEMLQNNSRIRVIRTFTSFHITVDNHYHRNKGQGNELRVNSKCLPQNVLLCTCCAILLF